MRIVGGTLKGRRLATPKSDLTRPTTDRTREALFNILTHMDGDPLRDARVLDLFAGTGALGFEALSRGASAALFVEDNSAARALIQTNIESFAVQGRARIYRRDATKLGEIGTVAPFDLVFADPPYGKGFGERAFAAAARGGWLKDGALCVSEESSDAPFVPPDGFSLIDERNWGSTVMRFLRADNRTL